VPDDAPAARLAVVRAQGLLPPFGPGELAFADLDDEAQTFVAAVRAFGPRTRRPLRVRVGDVVLVGDVDGLTTNALLRHRMSSLKTKDRVLALVVHLAVAVARAADPAGWPAHTVVLGRDTAAPCRLGALAAAHAGELLGQLVAGYQAGLREPLPFFPDSSAEFVAKGLDAARKKFAPGFRNQGPPESEDSANVLCFRGREPLDLPGFAAWATTVFAALGAAEGAP
jgi:exodeoxyribonuclease V gamma subunit